MTHLDKCIQCPKCGTKTMRKALGKNPVAEYFDDKCHSYFTVCELVHCWNYDGADFIADDYQIPPDSVWNTIRAELEVRNAPTKFEKQLIDNSISRILPEGVEFVWNEDKIVATTWFDGDSVSVIDEPTFKSPSERLEAYEMVDRMFIGIPEWSCEDNSVDTGATHA